MSPTHSCRHGDHSSEISWSTMMPGESSLNPSIRFHPELGGLSLAPDHQPQKATESPKEQSGSGSWRAWPFVSPSRASGHLGEEAEWGPRPGDQGERAMQNPGWAACFCGLLPLPAGWPRPSLLKGKRTGNTKRIAGHRLLFLKKRLRRDLNIERKSE